MMMTQNRDMEQTRRSDHGFNCTLWKNRTSRWIGYRSERKGGILGFLVPKRICSSYYYLLLSFFVTTDFFLVLLKVLCKQNSVPLLPATWIFLFRNSTVWQVFVWGMHGKGRGVKNSVMDVNFEMPIIHSSGDVKQSIGYLSEVLGQQQNLEVSHIKLVHRFMEMDEITQAESEERKKEPTMES